MARKLGSISGSARGSAEAMCTLPRENGRMKFAAIVMWCLSGFGVTDGSIKPGSKTSLCTRIVSTRSLSLPISGATDVLDLRYGRVVEPCSLQCDLRLLRGPGIHCKSTIEVREH